MDLTITADDFDDSTQHLYDVLVADEDIDAEYVDNYLRAQVAHSINELFNNKDTVSEQLAERDD